MASIIVNCTVARRGTMILVADCHGLRASEVCDLQWHQVELVSRFRSSHHYAARSFANFGIKGTLAIYDSSAVFGFEVPTQTRGYNDRNFKSTALPAVPRHRQGTPHPPARERKITSGPFPKSPLFFGFWALTH